jgi:hypothetical protein
LSSGEPISILWSTQRDVIAPIGQEKPDMSLALSKPIAAYIAGANAHDPDACAACFSDDAVVRDENREWRGPAAIRAWKAEVSKKYRPTLEVVRLAKADGKTIVTGRVTGTFPGSPIELRYAFTLDGEKIARLEILG